MQAGLYRVWALCCYLALRLVAFWTDGRHVKTEWLGRREAILPESRIISH